MPSMVTRDGKPVSPVFEDENEAFTWLLKHQSMSTDWAIKYEGYAIVTRDDLTDTEGDDE